MPATSTRSVHPRPGRGRGPAGRPAPRRLAALVAALLALGALGAPAAGASGNRTGDADPTGAASLHDALDEAAQRVDVAETAAERAAGAYATAYGTLAELEDRLAVLDRRIAAGERRADELRVLVQRRAVEAYMGRADTGAVDFFRADVPMDFWRRTALLDAANAEDNAALAEFRALNERLETQRAEAAMDRLAIDGTLDEIRDAQRTVEAELAEAEAARAEIRRRIATEEARRAEEAEQAAAREAARRQAAEEAAARAAPAPSPDGTPPASAPPSTSAPTTAPPTTSPPPTSPPSTPPSNPPSNLPSSGGIICPIAGPLAFVDSWGAPRSGGRTHQGVDLMSPTGTPNVAVVPGTITHTNGALSGLGIFLRGDDGHSYWYFHLSAFEGGPRRVSQGEVIGYVGDTGNATGTPHTHFEYRPNHGPAVNPYPLVRAAC